MTMILKKPPYKFFVRKQEDTRKILTMNKKRVGLVRRKTCRRSMAQSYLICLLRRAKRARA